MNEAPSIRAFGKELRQRILAGLGRLAGMAERIEQALGLRLEA